MTVQAPALSFTASILGSGEVEFVAENGEERAVGLGIDSVPRAVHHDFDGSRHGPPIGFSALSIYPWTATLRMFGAWLSLVERLVRDQEAGGSNPLAPTNLFSNLQ